MPITRTSGQGRRLGSVNKSTADVKALAGKYGPAAIDRLALLGGLCPPHPGAESEGAQVMAMRELLDRAYGKSQLQVSGDKDKPLVVDFRWADSSPVVAKVIEAVVEETIREDEAEQPEIVWQNGDGSDTSKE